jgi:hypothetical protein
MSEQKNNEAKVVEVVLLGAHTHGGISYDKGDKIKVSEPERDWLIGQKKVADSAATKEIAK